MGSGALSEHFVFKISISNQLVFFMITNHLVISIPVLLSANPKDRSGSIRYVIGSRELWQAGKERMNAAKCQNGGQSRAHRPWFFWSIYILKPFGQYICATLQKSNYLLNFVSIIALSSIYFVKIVKVKVLHLTARTFVALIFCFGFRNAFWRAAMKK